MLEVTRGVVVGVLSLAAFVLTSTSVAGATPDRQPLPVPPDFTGAFCGPAVGDVLVHPLVANEFITSFTKADGVTRYQISGRVVVEITANGKTLDVNASGPETITVTSAVVSIVGRGQGLVINIAGVGIWLYSGRVMIDPATGLALSYTGHITDICALLS